MLACDSWLIIILLENVRGGDDNFGVNELTLENGVLSLLVRGSNQGMAVVFKILPQAELILRCPEQARLVFGMLATLKKS